MTYSDWLKSTGKPNTRESLEEWAAKYSPDFLADPELASFSEIYGEELSAEVEDVSEFLGQAGAAVAETQFGQTLKWLIIGGVVLVSLVAAASIARSIRG